MINSMAILTYNDLVPYLIKTSSLALKFAMFLLVCSNIESSETSLQYEMPIQNVDSCLTYLVLLMKLSL